ncbi:hypothetical protein [Bacillus sp. FJAT-51639]|uniref:hypothetical protein n=1 Tax=Bacillus bruguierae TaxID=3127667 RepID=UPI003013AEB2
MKSVLTILATTSNKITIGKTSAFYDMKFAKVLKRYDNYLCYDIFKEIIRGNKQPHPYIREKGEQVIFNEDCKLIERIPINPDDFED